MLRPNWWPGVGLALLVSVSCAKGYVDDDALAPDPADVPAVEIFDPPDAGDLDAWSETDVGVDPDTGVASDTVTLFDNGSPSPEDTGVTPHPDVPVPVDVPVDAGPSCAPVAACGGCVAQSGCGWCSTTGRCVVGTAAGPSSETCGAGWSWGVCAPPIDPCASRASCGACAGQPTCGWCKATLQCMTGTSAGPTAGSCVGEWAWTRSACTAASSDSCRRQGNCTLCRLQSSCGWCEDSDTCHGGSSAGPSDRACDRSQWGWSTTLCL